MMKHFNFTVKNLTLYGFYNIVFKTIQEKYEIKKKKEREKMSKPEFQDNYSGTSENSQ